MSVTNREGSWWRIRHLLVRAALCVSLFASLAYAPPKRENLKGKHGYPKGEGKSASVLARQATMKDALAKASHVYATIVSAPVVTDIKPGFHADAERIPSQETAAGASPNRVALALGKLEKKPSKKQQTTIGYQWLHCSAWEFGEIRNAAGDIGTRETPQQARNLVLGTGVSNHLMISYENALQKLANSDECRDGKVAFTLIANPIRDDDLFPFLASSIEWRVENSTRPAARGIDTGCSRV